ncbi:MAG: glutathione S-transferase N-terminal domain-containing protein [Fimbriimonadaceae bacterium]|nr:glutathione S-transferase N-terminal domain-containing protein [Alphaproteobacteria bacterium]
MMFLAEKGVKNVEVVELDVAGGACRATEFLAKTPLGQVPVLELDDGTVISESAAIARYFEDKIPEPVLAGADAAEKALVEMWVRRTESGLMNNAAAYFHHATPGFGPLELYQNQDRGTHCREQYLTNLTRLDKQLEGRQYITGTRYTFADMTALSAIDFAKFCGIEIPTGLPNLTGWYARVCERPSASA